MQQNLGDLVDKLSILSRKLYFGEEEAYKEHKDIVDHLNTAALKGTLGDILSASIRLTQMNFEIWNLENEIRKGGEGKLGLEEVGRRAILIRDLNRKRIKYKNQINELVGGYKEVKVNHASQ